MAYYSVKHRQTGELFREEADSKTKLKKSLTRFNGHEYCSFWTINEIDVTEWNRLKKHGVTGVPNHYCS
jgi:hypothetical protein